MNRFGARLCLFLALGFGLTASSLSSPLLGSVFAEEPVKATIKAKEPKADGTQELTVTLDIAHPFHIYANPVGLEDLESVQTKVLVSGTSKKTSFKVDYPKGKLIRDPLVGNHSVYEGKVEIPVKVTRGEKAEEITVQVKFQACDDKRCLPPATLKLTVK